MELILGQTAELCCNTTDSHIRALNSHLCTKVASHLQRSLIVSAWRISPKVRHAVCQRSCDDRALGEAL